MIDYEIIKQYLGMHEYSFAALTIFILLLTYNYTVSAILYSIIVIAASIYVQPFSDMKLTGELLSYFSVGFFIVYLAIPFIYILLAVLEPVLYISLTLFTIQQAPIFYYKMMTPK
jgi:hypothetical protein